MPNVPASISKGLIQVQALSDTGSNALVYDSNLGFAYIGIDPVLGAANTLTVVASSTSANRARAASIYSLQIDITPTITKDTGGNFTAMIYYDSGEIIHNSGTTLLDFEFIGLCQSIANDAGNTAVLN